jgi:hypothetical protein
VPYPERLSRGLVLVKWWLLALPHFIVLSILAGGGLWAGSRFTSDGGWNSAAGAGGLVTLLVLIAAIVLLFTGRYPQSLYDFVVGINRWALRVAAYTGLMTDHYPPFRLDQGGTDPATLPGGPTPPAPASPSAGGQQAPAPAAG